MSTGSGHNIVTTETRSFFSRSPSCPGKRTYSSFMTAAPGDKVGTWGPGERTSSTCLADIAAIIAKQCCQLHFPGCFAGKEEQILFRDKTLNHPTIFYVMLFSSVFWEVRAGRTESTPSCPEAVVVKRQGANILQGFKVNVRQYIYVRLKHRVSRWITLVVRLLQTA